jgi:hypothetical protein
MKRIHSAEELGQYAAERQAERADRVTRKELMRLEGLEPPRAFAQ